MRTFASIGVLAAALIVSPQVMAQRASLADRVAVLEQRAAGEQNGTELVNQISQLRSEVQELRGQLEQLQQQQEQAKQSQRAQYLDLSGRLDRLENGSTAPAGTVAVPPPVSTSATATAPTAAAAGSGLAGKDEQTAYGYAFDALKSGDYVESARRLRDFLAAFPGGQLAPNALYWLGESYYVTQNYAMAGDQFRALLDRYPSHDKAPGALLKLGLTQYGQKQYPQAEATLRQVLQRYPGTDVARTAQDRLRSMQIAGNR
ncbi:MAG TPA: tol-pal system protein YbgF [Thermomonas sp.]|uniref:Cell division coordinator CpoB n=1 Tax=Thermomonas beijingensis TaxID=2872701 RepID=A0ABS7TBD1_9GAMM|nr:tol-pal system protein YbgF [Thermomonas beijingensis]MBS0458955.1 tol-pal system protein YbgF [Pseudomonadota bacterium]MBZ4185115.1 tol-pal system protein YbgF [Thermomonas beijingensis]MDE2381948.1 tol-pal system protein YbgF [Xanthomonadaceae bacterium]HQQ59466.1 tol-pal system protein YbgF [Thermomonas sp.]